MELPGVMINKTRPGRMTRFRITEISGVDRPANELCKVVFIKRAEPAASPIGPGPELGVDWRALKAANLANLEKAARERAAADPSKTFEKHYVEALMSPNGQRAADWTR